jgi:hypothetical protein
VAEFAGDSEDAHFDDGALRERLSRPVHFVALDFPLSCEQTSVHGATDSLDHRDSDGADYTRETLRIVAGFF